MVPAMKVVYWKDTDTMYVTFRDDVETRELEEIAPGVVADFAESGELVGIEVYDAASEKVDLSKLEVEDLVPHSKARSSS
jgi:uncharacterized protein YuzE